MTKGPNLKSAFSYISGCKQSAKTNHAKKYTTKIFMSSPIFKNNFKISDSKNGSENAL